METDTTSPDLEAGLNILREAGRSGMLRWDAGDLAETILDDAWNASGLKDVDLDDAGRQWWAVDGQGVLMASYEGGLRERARDARGPEILYFKDEPGSSNLEEILHADESAAYRAGRIFKALPPGASRAEFVQVVRDAFPVLAPPHAQRIVDGVIRERARRPIPQFVPDADGFIHTGCALTVSNESVQLRKTAINMYLEKRAARPDRAPYHELEVALAQAAAPTNDELGGWIDRLYEFDGSHEARAALLRLKLGMVPASATGCTLRTLDYQPGQQHTAPTWLVKGLFPNRGLGMVVGESQAGKSFLTIHAAACVARGLPLFGRKVKPGGVLYIAAEGGSSVLPRIQAADEALGATLPANHMLRPSGALATAPIKVVVETPNLSRDGDTAALKRTVEAAARAFDQEGHTLRLVVVDTLHAALGGADENSAADMGHALKPLREVAEELGLFVLIVHHFGKDVERGARGSGSLRAAVDTELELRVPSFEGSKAKPAAVTRRVTVTKQRDGAVGDESHFHLNIIELGRDEDGDPWTTCTVAPCAAPAGSAGESRGKWDVRLKRAIEAAVVEHGAPRAPMKMVRGYFNNGGPADETDGARWKGFTRALEKARDNGTVECSPCGEWVWFSNAARDTGHLDTP